MTTMQRQVDDELLVDFLSLRRLYGSSVDAAEELTRRGFTTTGTRAGRNLRAGLGQPAHTHEVAGGAPRALEEHHGARIDPALKPR